METAINSVSRPTYESVRSEIGKKLKMKNNKMCNAQNAIHTNPVLQSRLGRTLEACLRIDIGLLN